MQSANFERIHADIVYRMKQAPVVSMGSWQSTTKNPYALEMRELLHEHFEYLLPRTLEELDLAVKPFQPWADKHFEHERVSGCPINPGTTYKEWRYPASAAEHTDFQFSHSYAERYWPQFAGKTPGGELDYPKLVKENARPHFGIRHSYGDLAGVVRLLAQDHTTRQAYLPIFYPEDITAALKKERIPCTLGYHFICRNGGLDIVYPMRSCDLVRHFRDDVYLTARLVLWVLDRLREQSPNKGWDAVRPGKLVMNITSLHCFATDNLENL
jgi:thymidylate synthase